MKTAIPLSCIVLLLTFVAGCASQPAADDHRIPDPVITDVVFKVGQPYVVNITGEYFKMESNYKKDVMCSLNGRNWFGATKIQASSPTQYVAELPFGVDYPEVWVRVFGMNGEYSGPYLAHTVR